MTQDSSPPPLIIDYCTPGDVTPNRLPRWLSAILLAGGVVVPVLAIGLVTFLLRNLGVNWGPDRNDPPIKVLAHPLFAWPFYLLAMAVGVSIIRLIRNPLASAMDRWIYASFWLGLIINVQYLLLAASSIVDGGDGESIAFMIADAIGVAIFLAMVLVPLRHRHPAGGANLRILILTRRIGFGLLVWFGCFAIGILSIGVGKGRIPYEQCLTALFCFLGLPHLQVAAFIGAILAVRSLAPERKQRKDIPLWLSAYLASWMASGGMLVWSWYLHPMHARSLSYIATAASRGHRRWVGSRAVDLPDGQAILINRQLHRLISLELILAWRAPSVHRPLRGFYDRVGPTLAAGLRNPWLADLAYVALKPFEWLAGVIVFFVGLERMQDTLGGQP